METTLKELVEIGILTEKDAEQLKEALGESIASQPHNGVKVWIYDGFYEDFRAIQANQKVLWSVKTPEPTDAEIQEWNEIHDMMCESCYPFRPFEPHAPLGIGYVRSSEPTEEEIADWQKYNQYLIDMDWELARKCVNWLDPKPEPPYQPDDVDWWPGADFWKGV